MLDNGDKIKKRLLDSCKAIAVVGLSDNSRRPSYRIASYLQNQGYRIIPVNPNVKVVLGEKAYPHLGEVPDQVDLVSVFRRRGVEEIIESADKAGIPAVWVQPGIECSERTIKLAVERHIELIKGTCIMADHNYLSRQPME